ncbi:AEC family transporter [Methylopila turkensis]|uniref:Transporter n=1 Tax=Methylopila turkensis TaxID=1437816 RepID=A0A9W6JND7_9HYPH|nr:AEC family transporter [Methylopila turkensis]GLK80820.1 transporter [Methylopila turkensis]
MIIAIESLLPSLLLIVLGYGLARTTMFSPPMWEGVERLNYYVLFPMLLLVTLVRADLRGLAIAPMAAAMILAVLVVAGAMLLSRRLWLQSPGVDGPAFSSLFQGAVRWQTPVALAVAASLYGREGLALAAIGVAAMIPLLNVLSVAVIAANGAGEPPTIARILREIVRNPLFLSTVAGGALNGFGVTVYGPVVETLDLLGRGALGVGLLLVGVGLTFRTLAPRRELIAIVAIKLAVMPALMTGAAWAFGVEGVALAIVAICGAVPTASSSYVLARRLGGDAPLMAAIITAQMVVSFTTLPVVVGLLEGVAPPPAMHQQGR